MATLKEPLELANLQYLKERIKGKLSHLRINRIVPLLELMLKVNEDERPNFIQLKHFYNQNFNFLNFNLIAQARLLAEMVNRKVFSARNFNILYFEGSNITFKIKTQNTKLFVNLNAKCNNESLSTIEKEIFSDLMKNHKLSDTFVCKICNNIIRIGKCSIIKSKCPCGY